MSYLQKLRELVGEEAFKKVEADLGKKDLIVNDGTYIPKEKFDKVNDDLKALKTEKEKLTTDLKTAQDDLKKIQDDKNSGNKTLEQKIEDLTKKIADQDKKISDKDNELQLSKVEGVLKEQLTTAGVSNPKNLKLLLKEFDLSNTKLTDDGKIEGFDETVKKLQEDYKPLFGEDNFGGTPPGGKGGGGGDDNLKEVSTEDFFTSEVFGSKK